MLGEISFFVICWTLKAASSAVNSFPLFHFTPLRNWNVQVFKSSDAVHFSARRGFVAPFASAYVRVSDTCRISEYAWRHSTPHGLSILMTRSPHFRVPPLF